MTVKATERTITEFHFTLSTEEAALFIDDPARAGALLRLELLAAGASGSPDAAVAPAGGGVN